MRRSSYVPVPLVVLGLALSACGGPSTSSGGAARNATHGTFTMAVPLDPGAFDPYRGKINNIGYIPLAYDSLVNLRPDGTVVSGLADKWTEDARSGTFTLKPGITCSDGTALTARQVADDINFLSDPANQSPLSGVLTPTVPFSATGDDASRTVKVVLKRPFGFLLRSIGLAPVMCANGLKNPKALSTASSGTGPFVLTKVVPGQTYTFTVRKGYTWGPGGATTNAPGTPATVVLKVISNQTTAANLLLGGELNMAQIGGADQERLNARHLGTAAYHSGLALYFNHIGGRPTADQQVRQALIQALDRTQLVKISSGGNGEPATKLLALEPRTCPGDTVNGQLATYDVAAAAALLDRAGWVKGSGGVRGKNGRPLTIDLHYGSDFDPLDKPTAEFVAQQWKAVGIKVTLSGDDAAKAVNVMNKTSNWDAYAQEYGFFLPTQLVPYASGTTPPNGINVAGIDNPTYDQLVAKAAAMTPPAACTLWNQAEQALIRQSDIMPISFRPTTFYLQHAQAQVAAFYYPIPTSIRVLR
jgi:peptide/nickel transport system substrate-binding protein